MSEADKRQVGGVHYKNVNPAQEHWNLVAAYGWDYFTAQVIKYMMRWPRKNGLQDLEKARHFLDKLIELETARLPPNGGGGGGSHDTVTISLTGPGGGVGR